MKIFHVLFVSCSCLLYANSYDEYLSFLQKYPIPHGSYQAGEIEIATDPTVIASIEETQKARLIKKGYSEAQAHEFSRVEIVSEDQYWMWIRDGVIFPTGAKGTYDRLIWRGSLQGPVGVAVLPILPNGKIVLNLNYRHATRSWELELPRGLKKEKETLEEAALRELSEETGLEASLPLHLGSMTLDSGMLNSVVPVFLGKVLKEGLSDQEYSEAIKGTLAFSKEEIKQGLKQGYLEVDGKPVPLRDAFVTFALLQAEIRGLL